jgi:hypothetical protein
MSVAPYCGPADPISSSIHLTNPATATIPAAMHSLTVPTSSSTQGTDSYLLPGADGALAFPITSLQFTAPVMVSRAHQGSAEIPSPQYTSPVTVTRASEHGLAAPITYGPAQSSAPVTGHPDGPVTSLSAPNQEQSGILAKISGDTLDIQSAITDEPMKTRFEAAKLQRVPHAKPDSFDISPVKTARSNQPTQELQPCLAEIVPGVLADGSSHAQLTDSTSAQPFAGSLAAFQPSMPNLISPTQDSPSASLVSFSCRSLAAFQPSVSNLISPREPSTELSDRLQPPESLRAAMSPRASGASDKPLRASFPPASPAPASLDDQPTLRRVKSLFPHRATMLTPAARCAGGQLLPDVPELQTYRNGPQRRAGAGVPSSVMFIDCPVVHTYTKDPGTPSAEPSSPGAPHDTNASTIRRQQNRQRGSYRIARHALEFQLGNPSGMSLSAPLAPASTGPEINAAAFSMPLEAIHEQPWEGTSVRQPSTGSTEPSGLLFNTFGDGIGVSRALVDPIRMGHATGLAKAFKSCKNSVAAEGLKHDVELFGSGTAGPLSNRSRSSGGDTVCFGPAWCILCIN